MIKAIIIEDEKAARDNLINSLQEVYPDISVQAELTTVAESIRYLSQPAEAQLIFSDVQLGDGLSFEIFEKTHSRIPVIFVTGYDQFMMNAFDYNGIDYLLKPVTSPDLRKAVDKYRMLENHFAHNPQPLDQLMEYVYKKKRTRILVKKGLENISLRFEELVLFFTENKIVYVLDAQGRKYLCDKNLAELEEELDSAIFFRANRQYIVNINFIKGFKTYEKVKLKLDLVMPNLPHEIIISQETAPDFRRWICEA